MSHEFVPKFGQSENVLVAAETPETVPSDRYEKMISSPESRDLLREFSRVDLKSHLEKQKLNRLVYEQMRQRLPEVDEEKVNQEAQIKFNEMLALATESNFDELTELYNRKGFTARGQAQLEKLEAEGKYAAVIHLDLSGFKGINDNYGHFAGNEFLKKFAQVLVKNLPPTAGNIVGRWGGDEFAILLCDANQAEVIEVLQYIANDCAQITHEAPHIKTGEMHTLRVRKPHVGIAVWNPTSGESMLSLDKRADDAQVSDHERDKEQMSEVKELQRAEDYAGLAAAQRALLDDIKKLARNYPDLVPAARTAPRMPEVKEREVVAAPQASEDQPSLPFEDDSPSL